MTEEALALRNRLRERRAAIPAALRIAAAEAVAVHLLRLPALQKAKTLAGYWAIGGELPLHSLMTRMNPQTRYCLPVLQADRRLRFAPWRVGEPVVANRFGIPEPSNTADALAPEALDVVLLPLLGYTARGDRIGTGGGWYDRSFAFRNGTASPPLLVGVGFACQQVDAYAARDWDVPLDALVNERELIVCTR